MYETLATARAVYTARFTTGLVLLIAGALRWPSAVLAVILGSGRMPLFDVLVGTIGFWMAAANTGNLVRASSEHARWQEETRRRMREEFARATLPRQVFTLLLSVAEADGQPGDAEREIVRRFLLERFVDPVTYHDLRTWEAQHMPAGEVEGMARRMAAVLSPGERDTVFFWCCLVAFADGRFGAVEHERLQDVARGLGLPGFHARVIFHHARARAMAGAGKRPAGGAQRMGRYSPDQLRAFEILGLQAGASVDEIRARHRELVKEHHPDAHSHLGPVAAREATLRFREIQRAYELLVP